MPKKRSETTRERILDSALSLFNAQGTAAVTTNHLAAELEISPGNLYYHFRNKGEIIRALVQRWTERHDVPPEEIPPDEETAVAFLRFLRSRLEAGWEMRFLLRELMPLLQADDELRQRYRELHRNRQAEHREWMERLIKAGLMRDPESGLVMADLFRGYWLFSHFWIAEFDLMPDSFLETALDDALRTLFALYHPYFTERGFEDLRNLLPGM